MEDEFKNVLRDDTNTPMAMSQTSIASLLCDRAKKMKQLKKDAARKPYPSSVGDIGINLKGSSSKRSSKRSSSKSKNSSGSSSSSNKEKIPQSSTVKETVKPTKRRKKKTKKRKTTKKKKKKKKRRKKRTRMMKGWSRHKYVQLDHFKAIRIIIVLIWQIVDTIVHCEAYV